MRSYVARFNKEALLIDEVNDKVLVIAFTNRIQSGKFLFSVYKNDLKTIADMLYRDTKYMMLRMPNCLKRWTEEVEKHDDP